MVIAESRNTAQIFYISAEARKVLIDLERKAMCGLNPIVQRVVGIGVSNRRRGRGAFQRRLLDDGIQHAIRRNAVDTECVSEAHSAIFRSGKAKSQPDAGGIALVVRLLEVGDGLVDVEPTRHRAIEEIGICEAELSGPVDAGGLDTGTQEQAFTEQVAFRVAELTDERAVRRVSRAQLKFARGLFRNRYIQNRPIRLRAGRRLDVDVFEKAERLDARPGTIHQNAIIGVAFYQSEFAPNDLIKRSGVADDVDLLDINPLLLLDIENHVDLACVVIPLNSRMYFGERITLRADAVCQGVNRFVDQFGIIGSALHNRDQRTQFGGLELLEL